jgi:hypothetical protein
VLLVRKLERNPSVNIRGASTDSGPPSCPERNTERGIYDTHSNYSLSTLGFHKKENLWTRLCMDSSARTSPHFPLRDLGICGTPRLVQVDRSRALRTLVAAWMGIEEEIGVAALMKGSDICFKCSSLCSCPQSEYETQAV